MNGSDGAQAVAKDLAARYPEKYFYPDQYNNDANWKAHYATTALEIWRQTNGQVTHFLAGLGTSGTFVGISRRLKELGPHVETIAMQPDAPLHGLEGMKHMASAIVPGIYDPDLADLNVVVATEDAQTMTRRLAREEGLFVGVSSGANVIAALHLAQELEPGDVLVTILCDSGSRYMDENIWGID
jgi:cysteine synthase B